MYSYSEDKLQRLYRYNTLLVQRSFGPTFEENQATTLLRQLMASEAIVPY